MRGEAGEERSTIVGNYKAQPQMWRETEDLYLGEDEEANAMQIPFKSL